MEEPIKKKKKKRFYMLALKLSIVSFWINRLSLCKQGWSNVRISSYCVMRMEALSPKSISVTYFEVRLFRLGQGVAWMRYFLTASIIFF